MDNPNPIYYRDLVTPDNAITDLIRQLGDLIAKYGEVKSTIQADAAALAKSLENVSSATEGQRQVIEQTTHQSDALARQYQRTNDAERQAYRALLETTRAKKEQQQIDKLIVQLNNSAEGSYNKLSAQYRLNKIRLNELSEAERHGTQAGRKLEAETKAIYEQMNKLQLATGKAQLQVGHYERGLLSAVGVNGKFADVLTGSVKASEMFHGVVGALKGSLGAMIGVAGAAVATFKLFKNSLSETQTTGDGLRFAMAELNNVWDRFRKSVALMDFSGFIRGAAESAMAGRELAIVLDEVFERTNSVKLLKSALSAENAALEEAAKNTALSYEERLQAAEQYIANVKPIYEQELQTAKRVRDAELKNLFALTNQRQFATKEEREAAEEEFAANIKNYNLNEDRIQQAKRYNTALADNVAIESLIQQASAKTSEIYEQQLSRNRQIIADTPESIKELAGFLKQYSLTTDAQVKAYVDAQVAYNEAQAALYNENKRFVTLRNNIEAQQQKENEKNEQARRKAAEERAKAEKKAAEEAAKEKELAAAQKKRDEERALQEQRNAQNALLQAQLQSINLQIAVTRGGTDEMLQLRIAAINKQREIELTLNAQKDEAIRQQEIAINKKYDQQVRQLEIDFRTQTAMEMLRIQQDLQASEFDLLNKNERQKTQFRLQQEKERLQKILELNRVNGKELTDEQVATINNQIAAIDKESKKTPYNNIYEVLGIGLDSDQQDALNMALDTTKQAIGDAIAMWQQEAEAAIEAANARVESAKSALDAEIEARNNGYANNVVQAQKDLELEKQRQQKAIEEKQRAQKAQLAMDTITQASSLVTASANIWSSLSSIPYVGPILAAAALATMWGSFAASKIKAAQVAGQAEQYGDGTVELLQGGSHASGHDIDMGVKADGTRRRAEGGEYFAIINKRNSRRYGALIPDVINSFNDGTFAEKYQKANSSMSGVALAMVGGNDTDVSTLEQGVEAIRRQGERSRFVDGQGNTIEVYKNVTRKILKS